MNHGREDGGQKEGTEAERRGTGEGVFSVSISEKTSMDRKSLSVITPGEKNSTVDLGLSHYLVDRMSSLHIDPVLLVTSRTGEVYPFKCLPVQLLRTVHTSAEG